MLLLNPKSPKTFLHLRRLLCVRLVVFCLLYFLASSSFSSNFSAYEWIDVHEL